MQRRRRHLASECIFYISLISIAIGTTGILLFAIYPLVLWLFAGSHKEKGRITYIFPRISIIVVMRNAEKFVREKIWNCLTLDYPKDKVEIICYCDGSTDKTEEILHEFKDNIKILVSKEHKGKAYGLNASIQEARGDILVFSDVDARLERDALRRLLAHLHDESIGGVCGQRIIASKGSDLELSQRRYISFDSAIKTLETRVLGSITSNDGKLYAARKNLLKPIDPGSTDDFFVALSVVSSGARFIFEPRAFAYIPLPSRSLIHEIRRRRRIVTRSLRGLYLMKHLFNPRRYGLYSIGLFINKLIRRFLPIFFALVLMGVGILVTQAPVLVAITAALSGCGIVLVLLHTKLRNKTKKLINILVYFVAGLLGTALGLLDFLLGRQVTRWDPEAR